MGNCWSDPLDPVENNCGYHLFESDSEDEEEEEQETKEVEEAPPKKKTAFQVRPTHGHALCNAPCKKF